MERSKTVSNSRRRIRPRIGFRIDSNLQLTVTIHSDSCTALSKDCGCHNEALGRLSLLCLG
jgi:hypothetical protein